jgi:hypothetical protein
VKAFDPRITPESEISGFLFIRGVISWKGTYIASYIPLIPEGVAYSWSKFSNAARMYAALSK